MSLLSNQHATAQTTWHTNKQIHLVDECFALKIHLNTTSLAEINKSALTDHTNQKNHTINWSKVTVIDREPDRLTSLIKEATYIHKERAQSTNRDEGSY